MIGAADVGQVNEQYFVALKPQGEANFTTRTSFHYNDKRYIGSIIGFAQPLDLCGLFTKQMNEWCFFHAIINLLISENKIFMLIYDVNSSFFFAISMMKIYFQGRNLGLLER